AVSDRTFVPLARNKTGRPKPPGILSESRSRLHMHARTHGRADGNLLDIGALGAGRLGLLHSVGERLDVLEQGLFGEGNLANAGMQDTGLFNAAFYGATLGSLDGAGDVGRTPARPGVRRQV